MPTVATAAGGRRSAAGFGEVNDGVQHGGGAASPVGGVPYKTSGPLMALAQQLVATETESSM